MSCEDAVVAHSDGEPPGTVSVEGLRTEPGVSPAPGRAAPRPTPSIGPGDCLGRYTIERLVGAGGMGRVFAAVDPELGRDVAIKLIRPERSSAPSARARLLREAQAMARLHHPNVVTVYDVGAQDDEVFVAMEMIEGSTLADWMRAAERGWRTVLETFLAAGRGLAAAHSAGIVHRDFKPANVIVGRDRVVVVDFGLARAGTDITDADLGGPEQMLDVTVTATGERVGTPLYMAPEQHVGGAVTAKSDQYSFCVALWQALHGHAPSDGVAGSRRAEVPGWVNAALQRGLERAPERRWPEMNALLAALARDPARRRRQIAAGLAVIALGGLGVAGLVRARVDPCADAEARLAGIWDGPRKDSIQQAFAASGIPYARDTWRRARTRLDAYAAGWVDMHTETCRATRVEGRQSDTLLDLRMSCLERRRALLRGLADVWARGVDGPAVEHATAAADGLAPLADCADTRGLAERIQLPTDPALVAGIAGARARIDATQALRLSYHLADARKEASAARIEADATGWPQVRAEAAVAEADVLTDQGEPREAQWVEAARLAFAARDDRLAARALVGLTFDLSNDENKAERAFVVADVADGVVTRSGGDDRLRVELERYRGDALRIRGKYEEALAAYKAAYDDAARTLGPDAPVVLRIRLRLTDVTQLLGRYAEARRIGEENLSATIAVLGGEHPSVGSQLNSLGNVAIVDGDSDAATGYYRRALAILEKARGPDAVATALVQHNLARAEMDSGHLSEADKLLQPSIASLTRAFGPDHVEVTRALSDLATLRRKQGRFDEARTTVERVLEIKIKIKDATHPELAYPLIEIGMQNMARGAPAEALSPYRRALEIRSKALGADHILTQEATIRLAGALAALGRCADARPLLATASAVLEKLDGGTHPFLSEALTVRGTCELASGRAEQAMASLSRALENETKAKGPALDRGTTRWPLARALWSLGQRGAAVAAATTAEGELAGDADGARDRAAVHAWLAAHRPH
jgi:tetratricopeptide (TPR) repeat protein/predicted Ser/Thr protein kinase